MNGIPMPQSFPQASLVKGQSSNLFKLRISLEFAKLSWKSVKENLWDFGPGGKARKLGYSKL